MAKVLDRAFNALYAHAGKIQGHAVGVQGQEAAVGEVAQGVQQSQCRLISGAAKEGNSGFPRKSVPPRQVHRAQAALIMSVSLLHHSLLPSPVHVP